MKRQANRRAPPAIDPRQPSPSPSPVSSPEPLILEKTRRFEEPVCFCCSMSAGMYFVNIIVGSLCLGDMLFFMGVKSANVEGGFIFYHSDDQYGPWLTSTLWACGFVTVLIGVLALNFSPSKGKGAMLKYWKTSLFVFMTVWFVQKIVAAYKFSHVEWIDMLKQMSRKSVILDFAPDSWTDEFFWAVFILKSFPTNIFLFVANHWLTFVYFGIVVPLIILAWCANYISRYTNLTVRGKYQLMDGIAVIKARREQRRKQRLAAMGKTV